MTGNPFLKTTAQLANINKQRIANQQRSNAITEPYFVSQVYQLEHPSGSEKILTELKKEASDQKAKDEFVSKQLYNKQALTERTMMANEERRQLLTNRLSPAIDITYLHPKSIAELKEKGIPMKGISLIELEENGIPMEGIPIKNNLVKGFFGQSQSKKERSDSLDSMATTAMTTGDYSELAEVEFTPERFNKLTGDTFRAVAKAYGVDSVSAIAKIRPKLREKIREKGNYLTTR